MKIQISSFVLFVVLGVAVQAQEIKTLYKKLVPTVVQIYTEEATLSTTEPGVKTTMGGLGSGVMIDANGSILTAAHVVQTADEIMVRFSDGEVLKAKRIASSSSADVALIKTYVPPKNQKFAKLGDSDKVEIGDQVMMIGNPLELEFSLSVGYVSGKRRQAQFTNGAPWVEFIQTDASINQGNSGGPMFNMAGEIVGIASFIMTQSGGFEGIGFAASSNVCSEILLKEGNVWTGIEGEYIYGPIARILNVPQEGGLLVYKVVELSPAGVAGLKGGDFPFDLGGETVLLGGDIILAVNSISLADPENIESILNVLKKGKEFTFTVLRGGQVIDLQGNF